MERNQKTIEKVRFNIIYTIKKEESGYFDLMGIPELDSIVVQGEYEVQEDSEGQKYIEVY